MFVSACPVVENVCGRHEPTLLLEAVGRLPLFARRRNQSGRRVSKVLENSPFDWTTILESSDTGWADFGASFRRRKCLQSGPNRSCDMHKKQKTLHLLFPGHSSDFKDIQGISSMKIFLLVLTATQRSPTP